MKGAEEAICHICKRKFASEQHLLRHEKHSDMHQKKLRELGRDGDHAAKRHKGGSGSQAHASQAPASSGGVCAPIASMAPVVARQPATVVIWDLDETLILFNSLLTGQFMQQSSPEAAPTEKAAALERLAIELEVFVFQIPAAVAVCGVVPSELTIDLCVVCWWNVAVRGVYSG